MSSGKMIDGFMDPAVEFRGAPFWSWNSELSPERLREQIRIMKKMGMGGFFMHSRVGLQTPYLGEKWFGCVADCIDEAKKAGIAAWLYDEDRWPSGAAGGIVTADDRFKMKELLIEKVQDKAELSDKGCTLAYFAAHFEGEKVVSYRRITADEAVAADEVIIRCYFDFSAKSSDFNGETYLDTLNEAAVKKFIEVTHEAYYREFNAEFGGSVPGIFTDEPCYSLPYRGDVNLPWTVGLEEKFQAKYGYDLLDGMIELYFDCGNDVSRYRHDYYDLLTELFVNAFARQIGQWCADHHCLFTGHVLWEDELDGQTAYIGNAMRFYEYMQIPGIDLLTERWITYATAKQCTSVARQLGKKRRLSELYGCTGWDFPLSGHKALGDWQYAMGINFRCHHLYWYSMAAEAKRDYPASISEHSPWHTIYSKIEDHFARIGAVISAGEEIRDILVIHPIESAWCSQYRVSKGKVPAVARLNDEFIALANRLLAENLDFDYGDEGLLASHASVNGAIFTVGQAEYKAVVVPELKTIRSTTLELLKKFASSGGKVYYLNRIPQYVDAVRSDEAQAVFAGFTQVDTAELTGILGRDCRRISMTAPDGTQAAPLLAHFSQNGTDFALFVCNSGTEFAGNYLDHSMVRDRKLTFENVRIAVDAPAGRTVYELNTLDGTIHEIAYRYEGGKYIFDTSFDELGSRLFVFAAEKSDQALPVSCKAAAVARHKLTGVKSAIHRDEKNVLVLDHADVVIGDACVKENIFILHADDFLRKELGRPPRGGHMVQPYMQKKSAPAKLLDLQLKYTFICDAVPSDGCDLAIEYPELYTVKLNGKILEKAVSGSWIDPVLQLLHIPAEMLVKGANHLTLACQYHENLPGLESLFILGEFGVKNDIITALPESAEWGSWCEQGFPYYGGNFTYEFALPEVAGESLEFHIPQWRGAALGVKVNGSAEKLLIAPPYKVELTGSLKSSGGNRIEICVYGHRRNVFGPFYSLNKWPSWTGPAEFKKYETTQRQVVPCGIISEPYIEILSSTGK